MKFAEILGMRTHAITVSEQDPRLSALESTSSSHASSIGSLNTTVLGHTTAIGTISSTLATGITTNVTVMLTAAPTYATLHFTNGLLTSVT